MFAHYAVRRNIIHAVNITDKVNITCPQGQTSFKKAYHSRDRLFCGWEIGVFACGEDTHDLRLKSKLFDLQAGYANPFLARQARNCVQSNSSAVKRKEKNRPSSDGLFFSFGSGTRIRTQTYRVRVCCATFTQFRCIKFRIRLMLMHQHTEFAARGRAIGNYACWRCRKLTSPRMAIYRRRYAESAVLPLHNSAKCLYILTHNFPFVKYFFCFFIFFSERMIFVAKKQFSPLKKGCPDMQGSLFLYYYLS